MKQYSNYFWIMMIVAFICLVLSIMAFRAVQPEWSVIAISTSFVFWFAGIMAPDHEKYKQ